MSEFLFKHVNRYTSIGEADFEQISSYFELIKADKKEVISPSGKRCDELFFVVNGCVHSFFIDRAGVEKTILFAIENWWITDFLAFHHQWETDYTIQAVEPCEVLKITHQNYTQLLENHAAMETYFRNMFEIAAGSALRRMKYIFDYSKEEVFNTFMDHFPEFVTRVPQYMVATYLGLTPEYLSKIRAKKLS